MRNIQIPLYCFALSILLAGAIVGCTTSSAIKTTGVAVVTVDTGMQAWSAYVAQYHPPQSEIDAVHNAYNVYYAAALADKAALELSLSTTNSAAASTANASLATAETQLMAILNEYLGDHNL